MDKRLWNSPEKREKTAKKDTKLERKGEREMFFLSLKLQCRKMDLLPRKPHRFLFFLLLKIPGTQSYHYNQNTWTVQQLPNLTLKVGKKESGLFCKVHQSLFRSCILPNWCSCETANGGVGAEVGLRVEILGFFKRFPSFHPLK